MWDSGTGTPAHPLPGDPSTVDVDRMEVSGNGPQLFLTPMMASWGRRSSRDTRRISLIKNIMLFSVVPTQLHHGWQGEKRCEISINAIIGTRGRRPESHTMSSCKYIQCIFLKRGSCKQGFRYNHLRLQTPHRASSSEKHLHLCSLFSQC